MYLVFNQFIIRLFIQSPNRYKPGTHSAPGWVLGVGVELWTTCVVPACLLESLSEGSWFPLLPEWLFPPPPVSPLFREKAAKGNRDAFIPWGPPVPNISSASTIPR